MCVCVCLGGVGNGSGSPNKGRNNVLSFRRLHTNNILCETGSIEPDIWRFEDARRRRDASTMLVFGGRGWVYIYIYFWGYSILENRGGGRSEWRGWTCVCVCVYVLCLKLADLTEFSVNWVVKVGVVVLLG